MFKSNYFRSMILFCGLLTKVVLSISKFSPMFYPLPDGQDPDPFSTTVLVAYTKKRTLIKYRQLTINRGKLILLTMILTENIACPPSFLFRRTKIIFDYKINFNIKLIFNYF